MGGCLARLKLVVGVRRLSRCLAKAWFAALAALARAGVHWAFGSGRLETTTFKRNNDDIDISNTALEHAHRHPSARTKALNNDRERASCERQCGFRCCLAWHALLRATTTRLARITAEETCSGQQSGAYKERRALTRCAYFVRSNNSKITSCVSRLST